MNITKKIKIDYVEEQNCQVNIPNERKQIIHLINADSCQAQVNNEIINSNETTEYETNTKENQKNNNCGCSSYRNCKVCKLQKKQFIHQQRELNRQETLKNNEKLCDELRRKALENLGKSDLERKEKIIRAFRDTEILVNQSAEKYAQRYCQNNTSKDISQMFVVYKLLLLPEGALQKFVQSEDKEILKNEYKKYAKLVHPDKNDHPQATVAFQKLTKFWHQIPQLQ